MGAFSLAFSQFFTALTVFFTAFEKIAKTADNLATVAEESSGQYMDEARINRQKRLNQLTRELDASTQETKALPAS